MQCDLEIHETGEMFSEEENIPHRKKIKLDRQDTRGCDSEEAGRYDCPAKSCTFSAPSTGLLKNHWMNIHEEYMLLFLCPFPGC